MRVCRRLAAAFLVTVLCISVGITAYAEPEQTEEEAAEEQERQLQEQVYNMPVQSNEWTNWPKGPGTYGEAAIVMEVGTGAILYAKNVDEH